MFTESEHRIKARFNLFLTPSGDCVYRGLTLSEANDKMAALACSGITAVAELVFI